MTVISFTDQDIAKYTAADIASLAERLEKDEYSNPFEALRDWHLLKAPSFLLLISLLSITKYF